MIAVYRENEDLINIGAYVKGTNPHIDRAIDRMEHLNRFFRQRINEQADYDQSLVELQAILAESALSS